MRTSRSRTSAAVAVITVTMTRAGNRTAIHLDPCRSHRPTREFPDADTAVRFLRRVAAPRLVSALAALSRATAPGRGLFPADALTLAVWRDERDYRYRIVDRVLDFEASGRWEDSVEDLADYLDELWTFHAADWQYRVSRG